MKWRIVPVEPTEAVIQAFVDQVPHADFRAQAITDYAAMLDAAPSAADDEDQVWRMALAMSRESQPSVYAEAWVQRDASKYVGLARAALKAMEE